MFKAIQVPLATQLGDLRSAVLREIVALLCMFARKYPDALAANSQYYFREDSSSLLKLLNNGKRIISDMAHEGITGILNHVCLPK